MSKRCSKFTRQSHDGLLLVLALFTGLGLSFTAALMLDSIGVILLYLGITMLIVGEERIWKWERRAAQLRGIEAQRTGLWYVRFYVGAIVLVCWGVVQLGMDVFWH